MLFNAEGQCTEIPGQDRVPPRACVRSYPMVERDEMMWIWMGEPTKADPDKIIRFEWHTDRAWRKKRSYLHYQAPYTLIVDNLLDFSHLTYVHSTTIGTPSTATTRAQVEPDRRRPEDHAPLLQRSDSGQPKQHCHLPGPG